MTKIKTLRTAGRTGIGTLRGPRKPKNGSLHPEVVANLLFARTQAHPRAFRQGAALKKEKVQMEGGRGEKGWKM